jgi:hypothetical protein
MQIDTSAAFCSSRLASARLVREAATLHAPALDSREAHVTHESKRASLKRGQYAVKVPHASGLRVVVR